MPKKKTTHKKTTAKSHTHKAQKRTNYSLIFSVSFIGVLAIVVLVLNKRTAMQAVAGVSVTRGMFREATVQIPPIPGAAGYNVYYKQTSDPIFDHALRNIPVTDATAIIGYLKPGANYVYQISAYDTTGREFYFSPIQSLTNLQSM